MIIVIVDPFETAPDVLSAVDCLSLLIGGGLGHVAISARCLPAIVPVMFVIDQGEIVFRAKAGSPLDWATQGTVVAFEADRIHPGTGGWSIFVTGVARHLGRESRRDTYRVVSLSPDMVSGRRIEGMPMVEPINLAAPAIRPPSRDRSVAGRS
jgi:nitroimidazol reductase NimA-like FMN-containing flavoprotein (pyridoxamine 5'-phosphate oxidase superfamily)